jgi:hypothetical protein
MRFQFTDDYRGATLRRQKEADRIFTKWKYVPAGCSFRFAIRAPELLG